MAAPSGQSWGMDRNRCWMRLPSIMVLAPPRRSGTTKASRDSMKTRRHPVTTPGRLNGHKMRQNVCQRVAPRSRAIARVGDREHCL